MRNAMCKKWKLLSFIYHLEYFPFSYSSIFMRSQQLSLSFPPTPLLLSLFLSLSFFLSDILPFSENILCYYLPPLWTFTRPVVYSYFNFKSYSYFIPVSYFRNILSSLPEGLSTGHSKGIHFIPLRFIPLFSITTRLNYSLVSCICSTYVYTYIALLIIMKRKFIEYITFFNYYCIKDYAYI